ncbi:MAG: histidine phosphatase family protein [Bacteroidales bacterium]|nr:histidine phosphatase family protein [Bacteroidales bacterium]
MPRPLPKLFLVRHGETEWSKSGQHTGRSDIPLTPDGEALAVPLGRRLADIPFDQVLSSPLQRARRTAELAGFTPTLDPDLMEWDYGDYEGKRTAEIRQTRPDWELFHDGCPGGESVAAMTARVDRVVDKLQARAGTLLVFAHGHFLRSLAARWVREPLPFARALLLSTGSVSTLYCDHHTQDEPAILLWNDVGHLT